MFAPVDDLDLTDPRASIVIRHDESLQRDRLRTSYPRSESYSSSGH